ncbi:hypothetical protein ILYODFUR_026641 [Ilyodon furcidens]|uniref:G-protein coupled receptors family 1 profile domain-containing protein n=1 Tax=Ilyodon furcidens TaxID=33524 RepID=A0ABV0TM80_9TELE
MLINSSSFSPEVNYFCSNSKDVFFISAGMIAVKTVIVLLCTFILYLGYQQWRQHHSGKTATHSDLFTYHLVVMELFWCPGSLLYAFGYYNDNKAMKVVAYCCFSFTFFGEVLFHLLTCVEWYLAVVHPVIYMSFRNSRGVRIRNISIGCVWLMCFGLIIFCVDERGENVLIVVLCITVVSIVVITFCSISVLRVLISPQTGKNAGKKRRISQSKLRAFHTVTAISSVLWLWFGGIFVSYALSVSTMFSIDVNCVIRASLGWFDLPTSLVSPLLYLHGAGKLFCNSYKSW